ncbi:MAG: DUF3177 family protein [Trichodesmium sp. MO_231.B1]|uniref:DUF3177 family protein n=1 Tax=Okeania sp. SIO2F4 TaxID=2607790 RepID=UPI0025E25698|nr:DUF3177 family protein [Okeania sp. SIO2F4]MDJ0518845.1 DUF3177 family protein [Trichodesmium sp. MO_231.B1]
MLIVLPLAITSGLETLVWMDYRLAVLFTIVVPLFLLIWAFVKRSEPIQHLLIIYWRVASLFAITVYLMIAAVPIGFLTLLMSGFLITVTLWFWVDLNEEIRELRNSPLKASFTSWRWAATIYNLIGIISQIPFVVCAFKSRNDLLNEPFCNVWLDPPWLFKQIFHPDWPQEFIGFLGFSGLVIYTIFLCYFVLVKLQRQGRSATGN